MRIQVGQRPAGRGAPGLWVGAGAHSRPSSLAWASAGAVLRTRRHHQSRGAPLGLGLSPHTPGGRAAGQGPGLHPGRTGPLTPAPQPSAETGCEKALYPPQHHLGRDRDEGGAQPSGTLASAWRPPASPHGPMRRLTGSQHRAPDGPRGSGPVGARPRMETATPTGALLFADHSPLRSLRPDHTHGLWALHHPPAGRVCSTGLPRTSAHDRPREESGLQPGPAVLREPDLEHQAPGGRALALPRLPVRPCLRSAAP